MVPFSYAQNNHTDNFVASCHVCNRWKRSIMFDTIEAARIYLSLQWERKSDATSEASEPFRSQKNSRASIAVRSSLKVGRGSVFVQGYVALKTGSPSLWRFPNQECRQAREGSGNSGGSADDATGSLEGKHAKARNSEARGNPAAKNCKAGCCASTGC